MTFSWKEYNREYQRKFRAKQRREHLIAQGKCPVTEILLTSKYHPDDCPCGIRLVPIITEITIQTFNIHANLDDKSNP